MLSKIEEGTMTGNSAQYLRQFECEPPRFDNDELIRRYQAGEFLYHFEREDAERILRRRSTAHLNQKTARAA